MSLYGMMQTGGSGMNAQSNRLSTVAENIANSSTVGYKRASTEFSSMILPSSSGNYNSGGVETKVRYSISQEGAKTYTTSKSDMAIAGNGFFIVADANGQNFLTRAGAFTQDKSGNLTNSAGFTLMGYPYGDGTEPKVVVNGFEGLTEVNLASEGLKASGSTKGSMGANLPDSALTTDAPLSTSLVAYDSQGNTRLLDFVYSKTAANTWSLEVRDKATYVPASAGPPAVPAQGVLGTKTLTFDTKGVLTSTPATMTLSGINPLSTGGVLNPLTIDLSKTTQLGYKFNPDGGSVDGNAPSKAAGFEVNSDGVLFVRYENNKLEPRYRIALATVQSPDKLSPQQGNVYSQGADSGVIITGFPGSGSFGSITPGALESSNVDIAQELTAMIESQRSYTANSKVFQTGSDLLDVLVNLKR
ncbi:flagellar hook protein FlgE [Rhizobium sp. YIM 134829]|uniref:flagellar hook protein FlgE n=1 Tax=Rhizobium sp. YIM 134829 TaxID=3390453 RepID=UPI00397C0CFD